MSRTYKDMKIRVNGKRRKRPDTRKLARVVIELAQAQAEKDALVEHTKRKKRARKRARGQRGAA